MTQQTSILCTDLIFSWYVQGSHNIDFVVKIIALHGNGGNFFFASRTFGEMANKSRSCCCCILANKILVLTIWVADMPHFYCSPRHCIAASVMIMAYSKMLIFGFFHCTHSNSDVSQTWLNSHLIGWRELL
jgi:hypothetical protein